MSGRCLALWLITALAAGTVSSQLSHPDTKIIISFDPCNGHACPAGQTCKAVVNPRLLQLPVARCVKSSTTGDNGECAEVAVGSNILNCKTETEWTNIARIQCMLRGGTNSMQFTAMQLNHACYSRTSGATKFLSAAFSCCLTQATSSPSTETAPPASDLPNSDKPVPPKVTSTEPAASDQVSTTSSVTGSSTAAVQDDLVVTTYHYYVMALFAVAVLLIAFLIVVCTITRRRAQRRKNSSKAPPTVYINPSCEDHHNHLKHSHSNTTLLSTPDIALVQHQY